MHRFGKINDGAYNFFGLDNAVIRLGLDYGISDRLGIGIGRSSFDKTFDGYIKYKILQQSIGQKPVPVSISILGAITNNTSPKKSYLNAKYRTTYVTQLLIARKMTSAISLQVSPTWMHFNMVPTKSDKNDVYAAMIGGRIKVTKRMSITAEYNYFLPDQVESLDVDNSLSMGVDIETGGHVFQLVFSNSKGMTEPQYIARTDGKWHKGDIYFGFNVSRNFTLGKDKKKPKW
jgi:opacity protein-like surface antigen